MTTQPAPARKKSALNSRAVFFAIFIALIVFLLLFPGSFTKRPWHTALEGNSFSYLVQNDEGIFFAIDSGGQRLISFAEDGTYRWDTTISGTSPMRMIAPTPEGGAYVTTVELDGDSFIERATIEQYNANGNHEKTLYAETYEENNRPYDNSGFVDLRVFGHTLYYVQKSNGALSMYRIDLSALNARPERVVNYPMEDSDLSVLTAIGVPEAAAIYYIDKSGSIFMVQNGEEHVVAYPEQPEAPAFSVPYSLCYQDGTIYISDIGLRKLYAVTDNICREAGDLGSELSMDEMPMLYYWIAPAKDGGVAMTSRYDMVVFDPVMDETTVIEPLFPYGVQQRALLWGWWAALAAVCVFTLLLIISLFMYAYRRMGAEKLMNSIIMVLVVVTVTVLIITQYSSNINRRFETTTLDTLSGLSKLTASMIDGEKLNEIQSVDDYTSPAYEELRSSIRSAATAGKELYHYNNAEEIFEKEQENWDDGIYRLLMKIIDGRLCYIYSASESYGAIYPVDYGYEGTEYQTLYDENTQILFAGIMDYSGEYTYTITPIHDSSGAVAGLLEMGIDQRAFQEETNSLLREIALSVAVVVLVVLLLLKELMFFGQVFSQRAPKSAKPSIPVDAIRPVVFLIYLLDCFSLVITPLFAQSLYSEAMGVPMEIGVALVYSTAFLFLGLAALIGGRLSAKTGLYPLIVIGAIVLAAGQFAAFFAQSLWMLILSRALVGFGAGLTMNVIETFIAMQSDQRDVQRGFSMSEAGLNSGTNCGLIIGTAIGAAFGYPVVYLAAGGVGILLVLYILLIFRRNAMPDVTRAGDQEARGMSFVRFIFSRRVFAFFLFLIIPYLIMNAYIYYFLPLTGTAQGLSEENISRIIFAYGMIAIYLGPILTNALFSRGKIYLKLAAAGLIVAAAMALYSFIPTLPVLMAGVLMFALADSFFYPGQNIYYSQLPESLRYGAGAALSINNIVSGLAQTLSSYVLAAVIIFGPQQGIGVLAVGMVLCMALFALLSRSGKEKQST